MLPEGVRGSSCCQRVSGGHHAARGCQGVIMLLEGVRGHHAARGCQGSSCCQRVSGGHHAARGCQGVIMLPEGVRGSSCCQRVIMLPEGVRGSSCCQRVSGGHHAARGCQGVIMLLEGVRGSSCCQRVSGGYSMAAQANMTNWSTLCRVALVLLFFVFFCHSFGGGRIWDSTTPTVIPVSCENKHNGISFQLSRWILATKIKVELKFSIH